jgi:beta-glucosidase
VQLYIHRPVASVTQPVLELKAFKRVTLQAGEQRTLTLTLPARVFALWDGRMQEVIEPGPVDILVGPNSRDLKSASLQLS